MDQHPSINVTTSPSIVLEGEPQNSDIVALTYVIDSETSLKSLDWPSNTLKTKLPFNNIAFEIVNEDQPKDYSTTSVEVDLNESTNSKYCDDIEIFLQEAEALQELPQSEETQIYAERQKEAENILANSATEEAREKALRTEFWIIPDEPLNVNLPAQRPVECKEEAKGNSKSVRVFMCHICGKILKSRGSFKGHLIIHSGKKPYQCPHCEKRFNQHSSLKSHIRTHTGEKPHQCPICFNCYKTYSSLTSHVATHSRIKPFKCTVCSKVFKTKVLLSAHTKLHLNGPFICTICYENFDKKSRLKMHTLSKHTNRKNFQCQYCSKSYALQCLLDKHMNVHLGIRNFVCDLCGEAYCWKSSLEAHKRTHFLKLRCEICNVQFTSSKKLASHRSRHSNPLPHKCTKCDKRYKFAYELKKHLARHKSDLTCDICHKGFITKVKFLKHKHVHE